MIYGQHPSDKMTIDILVLNTLVTDLRSPDFTFADELVGKGGLAKCKTKDMPKYPQKEMFKYTNQPNTTAGGPGNCAPLIARAGLSVGVAGYLGKGNYGGFGVQGKFFYNVMTANNIDVSAVLTHPNLPTGTTFIHEISPEERGGIAYFPNANNDFDFEVFKKHVERLNPKIVYYMYSGLSDKGDANNGQDLANFVKWCREKKGIVTIVDSHTLTGDPKGVIASRKPVKEYKLLEPIFPEVDIFFTSLDDARMIANTVDYWKKFSRSIMIDDNIFPKRFLNILSYRSDLKEGRTRLFGVTFSRGALYVKITPENKYTHAKPVESKFMAGEVVDLVGAGDAFRAGLLTYIAKNLDAFRAGTMNFEEAVQMGNLFASLYIKAPLDKRYDDIRPYENMLKVVKSKQTFQTLEDLRVALK